MTCSERIILDPTEETTGRTELDITPWIGQEGIDWGDASISGYMSESDVGEYPVDYRLPNREISGPLVFSATYGGTTAQSARDLIQEKFALFQREGGVVKRITTSGGTVYADAVDATFHATSYSGAMAAQDLDIEANFSLSCIPDFYGTEVDLGSHTSTGSELIWTETGIEGNHPGRMRMVIDNDSAAAQRTMLYSFRAKNYDGLHPLSYEAETGLAAYAGTAIARTGAFGGTAISMICAGTYQTMGWAQFSHVGNYRMIGRMFSTGAGTTYGVLEWDADGQNSLQNDRIQVLGGSQFSYHDFGVVNLPSPVVGTRSSTFYFRASGAVGGENVQIDKFWFMPLDEYSGRVKDDVVTTSDGVLGPSKSAVLRTEGYFVERTPGNYYEMPVYGDLPRLPVPTAGTGGTVEVFLKGMRGDLGPGGGAATYASSGTADGLTAEIFYRPSWLFT